MSSHNNYNGMNPYSNYNNNMHPYSNQTATGANMNRSYSNTPEAGDPMLDPHLFETGMPSHPGGIGDMEYQTANEWDDGSYATVPQQRQTEPTYYQPFNSPSSYAPQVSGPQDAFAASITQQAHAEPAYSQPPSNPLSYPAELQDQQNVYVDSASYQPHTTPQNAFANPVIREHHAVPQTAFVDSVVHKPHAKSAYDPPPNNPFASLQNTPASAPEPLQDPPTTAPLDWTILANFPIPSFTQTSIASLPAIHTLYTAYTTTYTSPTASSATRMQHAQAFAHALLTHYYPTSQHFTVAPTSLGPLVEKGINFILAAEDGSDVLRDLPRTPARRPSKKKGGPTKKMRELAAAAAEKEKSAYEWTYVSGLQWDWIAPQDIAGFVVMKKVQVVDKETREEKEETRPYTYLGIMIDTFDELPRFSTANVLHRSDILSDALGRNAQLQSSYGILFYGPRIEFYTFQAGKPWVHNASDGKDGGAEEEAQQIEPVLEPLFGSSKRGVDVRRMGLEDVERVMRDVVCLGVEWEDGLKAEGFKGAGHRVEE